MIDINKKYQIREGREARIYATDGVGSRPIHGAYKTPEGWISHQWLIGGRQYYDQSSFLDLIEVKPRHRRTVWINDYGFEYYYFDTKEEANQHDEKYCKNEKRLGCIKIEYEFEEGEGL